MSIKTTHQLAAELLKCENVPVNVSVDISSGEDDSHRRVFGYECIGVDGRNLPVVTVLFEGCDNEDS